MDESGDNLSDDFDAFEDSEDGKLKNFSRNQTTYKNKPFDEALEISQDLSVAESFDGRDKKDRKLRNDKYDEAVDVSQSMDQSTMMNSKSTKSDEKGQQGVGMNRASDHTKSQSLNNNPFDEAFEFSRSGSEESFDTQAERKKPPPKAVTDQKASSIAQPQPIAKPQIAPRPVPTSVTAGKSTDSGSEDGEGEGEEAESFENLEGAYNPKDYQHLAVSAEVRDLFQYIERYKPQEVELETHLKCFVPDYIPAIGEMDSFIKIPRPDGKEDDMGLKFLDEPAVSQSDPTVLELQLRALSKKTQFGEVAVRSIEPTPAEIDKWVNSVSELHRSKPPPEVVYKRSMPDLERLMDAWPEDFEAALDHLRLPSPELELGLADYAKVLCSLLDIPTYENPIESLHVMFSLLVEFRNNPHFKARLGEGKIPGDDYGGADVLQIDPGYK